MKGAIRCGAPVALLVLTCACTTVAPAMPTAPTASNAQSGSTPVLPSAAPPGFPAVTRPARVYVGIDSPTYAMHGGPLASRYVLYDDGSFALQYASANYPFFEYLGTYTEANSLIKFLDKDAGWEATVSPRGESISVRYTLLMQHSDFLDGVYIRTP